MSDDAEDFLATMRSQIESRVRSQLRRHLDINPNTVPKQVVDIQIAQEVEKLERLYEKYDDEGSDQIANVVRTLIDDWLPELAHKLKWG